LYEKLKIRFLTSQQVCWRSKETTIFLSKQKERPCPLIYDDELGVMQISQESVENAWKYWTPNLHIFTKNVCQGSSIIPWHAFFIKMGKFGVPYFYASVTDLY